MESAYKVLSPKRGVKKIYFFLMMRLDEISVRDTALLEI